MHPHLHTKDNRGCEDVMIALDECHARGFLYKASGMCNQAKRDVTKCLRAERIERTRKNREKANEKRQETVQMWKDIDKNS
ncbi:cytochrome c oxidase biogenesis protein Cmc1-like protein [Tricharina praecox]|uniref:cytochrome c oxidase biogenesis protein Cmc1-like protein n=1 Tax=Tricharina praecox TaxID=43433 RepID=UPI00221F2E51|nr:cytochrome c oxidase biogenesis protein Cmc1-like protein [Tricharina praecox]KAI5846961.1 cytochrome c oxidase biogenesis protein Cmc1-like protein [Tricharina praecox]